MSDFHSVELESLRLAVDTLKSERAQIIAAKQKDARMALRFYKENKQLKAEVVRLRKALERIVSFYGETPYEGGSPLNIAQLALRENERK